MGGDLEDTVGAGLEDEEEADQHELDQQELDDTLTSEEEYIDESEEEDPEVGPGLSAGGLS